jgi:hypothetical protein
MGYETVDLNKYYEYGFLDAIKRAIIPSKFSSYLNSVGISKGSKIYTNNILGFHNEIIFNHILQELDIRSIINLAYTCYELCDEISKHYSQYNNLRGLVIKEASKLIPKRLGIELVDGQLTDGRIVDRFKETLMLIEYLFKKIPSLGIESFLIVPNTTIDELGIYCETITSIYLLRKICENPTEVNSFYGQTMYV